MKCYFKFQAFLNNGQNEYGPVVAEYDACFLIVSQGSWIMRLLWLLYYINNYNNIVVVYYMVFRLLH